jgi:hypothetical protein
MFLNPPDTIVSKDGEVKSKGSLKIWSLKGLSHEIDFKNVDENGQILALLRAAAGF